MASREILGGPVPPRRFQTVGGPAMFPDPIRSSLRPSIRSAGCASNPRNPAKRLSPALGQSRFPVNSPKSFLRSAHQGLMSLENHEGPPSLSPTFAALRARSDCTSPAVHPRTGLPRPGWGSDHHGLCQRAGWAESMPRNWHPTTRRPGNSDHSRSTSCRQSSEGRDPPGQPHQDADALSRSACRGEWVHHRGGHVSGNHRV